MDVMGAAPITTATGIVEASGGMQYSNIAVAGAATVYTKAVYVGLDKYFTLSYKAASTAGGIDLKIEIQQSFKLPTTEGATDTYWAEPVNMGDVVASLTVENTIYHQSLSLIPLPYFRLKITGGVNNSADAILNCWISKQGAN